MFINKLYSLLVTISLVLFTFNIAAGQDENPADGNTGEDKGGGIFNPTIKSDGGGGEKYDPCKEGNVTRRIRVVFSNLELNSFAQATNLPCDLYFGSTLPDSNESYFSSLSSLPWQDLEIPTGENKGLFGTSVPVVMSPRPAECHDDPPALTFSAEIKLDLYCKSTDFQGETIYTPVNLCGIGFDMSNLLEGLIDDETCSLAQTVTLAFCCHGADGENPFTMGRNSEIGNALSILYDGASEFTVINANSSHDDNNQISIWDYTGRILHSFNTKTDNEGFIRFNKDLPKGLFYISIASGTSLETKRVLVY